MSRQPATMPSRVLARSLFWAVGLVMAGGLTGLLPGVERQVVFSLDSGLAVRHPASGQAGHGTSAVFEGLDAASHQHFNFADMRRPVVLPVEVIGDAGQACTEFVDFDLADAATADRLLLTLHRGAYRDQAVNPQRGAKVSLRVNNGPWVDLTTSTTTSLEPEQRWGGLEGAFHTVRLTVASDHLVDGANHLALRFNGHDTLSIGFRLVAFNVLAANGDFLLADSDFVEDDPRAWPVGGGDAAQGAILWNDASLIEWPGAGPIAASCADCHAVDGSDLQYFAFSNRSIVARSTFHGLDHDQAQDLVAFIRTLDVPAHGRPWNPPYQPGPGIDDRPVVEWAAGAGYEAALLSEEATRDAMYHDGLPDPAVFAVDGSINHRTVPVAIMYPDWMAWLPDLHPRAVHETEYANQEDLEGRFGPRTLASAYADMHSHFAAGDWNRGVKALQFFAQRTGAAGGDIRDSSAYADPQEANRAVRHWASVKQWEVVTMYGLEGRAQELLGPDAEPRAWPTGARNVFELAPHRSAVNKSHLDFQTPLVGKYFSTAWYQLQVTLNSGVGNPLASRLTPVDWNYQPNHITDLLAFDDLEHPYRYVATMLEQIHVNAGREPGDAPFNVKQLHPARYAPSNADGSGHRIFRALDDETRVLLLAGLLSSTMDLFEQYPTSAWVRRADATNTGDDGSVEPVDYVPSLITDQSLTAAHHENRWADSFYTATARFRAAGVPEDVVQRMADWGAAMWPAGDWQGLMATAQ